MSNNGTLFPPPPPGFRYFQPKNSQGVLAKFCAQCGSHIDAHAYQWLTGGHGTVRACPPEHAIAPTSADLSRGSSVAELSGASQQQQQQRQVQQQQQSKQQAHMNQTHSRAYGAQHMLHPGEKVDTSLTSSVVNDRKTVGSVAAHHRFYGVHKTSNNSNNVSQQQQQLDSWDGNDIPRNANGLPAPIPRDHNDQMSEQDQQEHDFYQQQQQQQSQPRYDQHDANARFSRSYQLYDEAYSTPVPFGTDVDLANPPAVAPPKGRRYLAPLSADERAALAEQMQAQQFPRMSSIRERMERSNLQGAGGVAIDQDAVRPERAVQKSHITKPRRDAESKMKGAGMAWE